MFAVLDRANCGLTSIFFSTIGGGVTAEGAMLLG